MKRNEKISFHKQMNHYNAWVLCCVLGVLILYIVLNFHTVDKYETAFYQYRHISGFYTSLDNAAGHIKDYLYTDSADSYDAYEQDIRNAQQHIRGIHTESMAEGWRLVLLSNMVDSYTDQVIETKRVFDENLASYSEEYTKLLDYYDMIKNTSNLYYESITNDMENQIAQFHQLKVIVCFLSIGFAAVMIIWLIHYTRKTTKQIEEPLNSILKNIAMIKKGTYDLTKISNTNVEMHALCKALEEMAVNIENEIRMTKEKGELEKRLLEIENENLKKDELLAQSEYKMLQNQINPHFLFNTLNMTYRLALSENATKSAEMIEKTSALLRYGLDKQNKFSDLKSEIQAVENYVAIQEKRLGDRVVFEFHISQDLPNIAIPGVILQPLIENSLEHGLRDCERDGEIIISIRYEEPYVYLQVSDNGKGMESEKCEEMLLNGFHDASGDHLGLYNVTKRLETFYHDMVDISVDSSIGCGFSFLIKIKAV